MNENVNRAFMYGESVFATMKMIDGYVLDWQLHFERLKKGIEFLYGPFTDGDDWAMVLKNRLETRCQAEDGDKVLRLTIYKNQERGLKRTSIYSVTDLSIHLSASNYDRSRISNRPLCLRTCPATPRPKWWPPYLKAGSYLETILNQKCFLKPEDDDLLYLTTRDTVLESSVANIFIIRHNKLYTAPSGPNVLEGVMRRKIIECALDFFDDFTETESSIAQAWKADGVIGCNSIRGVFLIGKIDGREIVYTPETLAKIEALRRRVTG